MIRRYLVCALVFGLPVSTPLSARAQDVDLSGQVRIRSEGRDPAASGLSDFTSMRSRIALGASLENDVRVFVQLQDVRLFGEESHPLFDSSADQLDMHQAFAQLGSLEEGWSLRAGRQELNLGGQRLIGAVNWTQQAQSFDGARLRATTSRLDVDFIAFKLNEIGAASVDRSAELFGAYATLDVGSPGALDLYGFYEAADDGMSTDQGTVGARWHGRTGPWSYRAESSYQFGTRDGADVSAYMLGARVGTDVVDGRGTVTVWYDLLSGDDDPADDEVGVFETLFATNHKFYGFADLFLNIPVHTGGLGLQDLAVKTSLQVDEDWRIGVDLHSFRLAEDGTVSTTRLAEELDLTATYRYSTGATATAGFSWVAQADGISEIGRLTDDLFWGYLMLDVRF